MPVSASTLRILIDAGISGDALVNVVESIDADMAASCPTIDFAAERKRAADRLRMQARRRECPPEIWDKLRLEVFDRDGYRCVYCGNSPLTAHCDHVVPFSRGGASEAQNLVTSCPACNISKGARTPDEWCSSWG